MPPAYVPSGRPAASADRWNGEGVGRQARPPGRGRPVNWEGHGTIFSSGDRSKARRPHDRGRRADASLFFRDGRPADDLCRRRTCSSLAKVKWMRTPNGRGSGAVASVRLSPHRNRKRMNGKEAFGPAFPGWTSSGVSVSSPGERLPSRRDDCNDFPASICRRRHQPLRRWPASEPAPGAVTRPALRSNLRRLSSGRPAPIMQSVTVRQPNSGRP
jgi:hypothetical protein